ncbi:MAG: pyridoxamine 5'-phosphate oxidase [Myxococcota bacterium]
MSSRELEDLRTDYSGRPLEAEDVAGKDPLVLVRQWLDEALKAGAREPTAMTLATAGADGYPDARIVLLKGLEGGALRFYTNYDSAKGEQLNAQPRATLVLFWAELERQVRVRGTVGKLPRDVSQAYFRSRPRGSQLGAWASAQSEVIDTREVLETRLDAIQRAYPEGTEFPLPVHWGGYGVVPDEVELWQCRPSRLHDRFRARRAGEGWLWERLSP